LANGAIALAELHENLTLSLLPTFNNSFPISAQQQHQRQEQLHLRQLRRSRP
jgi:hypothetical protein